MRDPSSACVVVDRVAIDAEKRGDLVSGHDLIRWLRELEWRRLGSAEEKLLVDVEPASEHAERDDVVARCERLGHLGGLYAPSAGMRARATGARWYG